nr:MAG TPA: hypothetical protein [Caudoviricetes sp.]
MKLSLKNTYKVGMLVPTTNVIRITREQHIRKRKNYTKDEINIKYWILI